MPRHRRCHRCVTHRRHSNPGYVREHVGATSSMTMAKAKGSESKNYDTVNRGPDSRLTTALLQSETQRESRWLEQVAAEEASTAVQRSETGEQWVGELLTHVPLQACRQNLRGTNGETGKGGVGLPAEYCLSDAQHSTVIDVRCSLSFWLVEPSCLHFGSC